MLGQWAASGSTSDLSQAMLGWRAAMSGSKSDMGPVHRCSSGGLLTGPGWTGRGLVCGAGRDGGADPIGLRGTGGDGGLIQQSYAVAGDGGADLTIL